MNDVKMTRKPVILSDNTVICINVYRTTGNMLDEIYLSDYIEKEKDEDTAAQSLVDAISDYLSVRMIWALRDALAREIEAHNAEFGSSHPKDRPQHSWQDNQ